MYSNQCMYTSYVSIKTIKTISYTLTGDGKFSTATFFYYAFVNSDESLRRAKETDHVLVSFLYIGIN